MTMTMTETWTSIGTAAQQSLETARMNRDQSIHKLHQELRIPKDYSIVSCERGQTAPSITRPERNKAINFLVDRGTIKPEDDESIEDAMMAAMCRIIAKLDAANDKLPPERRASLKARDARGYKRYPKKTDFAKAMILQHPNLNARELAEKYAMAQSTVERARLMLQREGKL